MEQGSEFLEHVSDELSLAVLDVIGKYHIGSITDAVTIIMYGVRNMVYDMAADIGIDNPARYVRDAFLVAAEMSEKYSQKMADRHAVDEAIYILSKGKELHGDKE